MRKGLTAAAVLTLGGCSIGTLFDLPEHQVDAYETVVGFYRPLAASAVDALTGSKATTIEVSGLKRSVPPQPGDWATCARTWKEGDLLYHTVFIRNRAVLDTRRSVVIDRCEQELFSVVAKVPCFAEEDLPAPKGDQKPKAVARCWR